MRRIEAQTGALALPFVTTAAAMIVTPGYPVAAHATTIAVSVAIAVVTMVGIALAMKPSRGSRPRPIMAAAWTATVAIAIATMVEAVLLKPGGIDGRQWAPCGVLAFVALLCCTERDGDRPDGFMVARAAAMTALSLGLVLAASIGLSAATGRLSGEDGTTAMATLPFLVLVMAPMVQAMRADDAVRARLGVTAALLVYLIVVTSVGTYAWSQNGDAVGTSMLG